MLDYISVLAVPLILLLIPLYALIKKVPLYETFVDGAAEGWTVALKIMPFLVGMLVAIAVFRSSGAFAALAHLLSPFCRALGIPVDVLPIALMRPLSGSGSLALTAEVINQHGPDSFTGMLASVMQGSTDTTFYVLAVYFGSVGIKKYRYAPAVGLSADVISFICAVIVCRILYA